MNKTYNEIASNYKLWEEYVDPNGLMSEKEFDGMMIQERLDFMTNCFGAESRELSPVEGQQLQDLVFKLIEQESEERREELKQLLEDTWFGSHESISEFVERNEYQNRSLNSIAREYIDAA